MSNLEWSNRKIKSPVTEVGKEVQKLAPNTTQFDLLNRINLKVVNFLTSIPHIKKKLLLRYNDNCTNVGGEVNIRHRKHVNSRSYCFIFYRFTKVHKSKSGILVVDDDDDDHDHDDDDDHPQCSRNLLSKR